ncbi:MAG: cytochrome c [Phaeodactylibacter sp.]|uniref:cytochrome c n=1 Tax=Phaeodactylibacter sp. TaxID=1940289 RepID=UPI0032EB683E
MYKLLFTTLLATSFFVAVQHTPTLNDLRPEDAVADVLLRLGDQPAAHYPDTTLAGVSVEAGRGIMLTGFATAPDGGKASKQSKHYVCTACHNIKREDPDLSVSDPQARLEYVRDNGLPFLQGTALYGAVNRTSFYNGDYEQKYGSLVEPARHDLREAIQLCATECSQGRALEPWEMESVLAYLWTIGLRMDDLILSDKEKVTINQALAGEGEKAAAIQLIKSRYLAGSPATFVAPPEDRKAGYPVDKTDLENGRLVYELSCLHCHENERYSFFRLDDSKLTFQHLAKHFPKYTEYSVYQVGRYGTSPVPGSKPYMPNYTLEKLSHQQMEDLRAYIEHRAGGDR